MRIVIIISFLSAFMFACKSPAPKVTDLGQNIGAEVLNPAPITMAALLTKMESQDTVRTQLEAKVESVCKVKGCWMNLVPTDGSTAESIFVKFKDYGFFMPLDLTGNVIVDGIAYREVTTVDELRHYAEDEGKSAEEIAAITEPQEELKFMADGVIILK